MLLRAFFLIFAVSGLLLTFQNCGKTGFDSSMDNSSSESTMDAKFTNTPFPYDVTVNQMLFTSCSNTGSSSGGGFTFKAGAFDTSGTLVQFPRMTPAGLSLRSDFTTMFDDKAKYYNPSVRDDKLKHVLMTHPNDQNAQIHFSIRNRVNTKDMAYVRQANGAAVGSGQVNMTALEKVSSESIVNNFVKNRSAIINYVPDISLRDRRNLQVGIQVPISTNGTDQSTFRSDMINHMLVLGFSDVSQILTTGFGATPVGPDVANPGQLNARGYDLFFTNPLPATLQYPRRSISTVTERDLSGATPDLAKYDGKNVVWNCDRKFKIVRNEDRYATVNLASSVAPGYVQAEACPEETYDQLALGDNPDNTWTYFALRRMLPVESWDINVSRRCIVPKNAGACYEGTDKIVYDEVFFSNPGAGQYAGCKEGAADGFFECAHYLTMCIRTTAN